MEDSEVGVSQQIRSLQEQHRNSGKVLAECEALLLARTDHEEPRAIEAEETSVWPAAVVELNLVGSSLADDPKQGLYLH